MSRKRSDIEISADILRVAKQGAKKSRIVYKANINFMIFEKYFKRLAEAGLIQISTQRNRLFKTTEKGVQFLDHYMSFKEYLRQTNFESSQSDWYRS
jgi:predicted transcriptional regulator